MAVGAKGLLLLPLLLGHADALARAKPPRKQTAKSVGSGGGGFGGSAKATKSAGGGFAGDAAAALDLSGCMAAPLASALSAKLNGLRATPDNPQAWLEVGAVLVKAREYAEAERVFRMGAATCPGHEMLQAAALTLGGDSEAYWHGEPIGFNAVQNGRVDAQAAAAAAAPASATSESMFEASATSESMFEAYEPLPSVLQIWDQADRALDWSKAGGRGSVFRSRAPLIPARECAEAIRLAEAHSERRGGWSTARHVQAPTTDVPVSEVPELREWFDEKLEKVRGSGGGGGGGRGHEGLLRRSWRRWGEGAGGPGGAQGQGWVVVAKMGGGATRMGRGCRAFSEASD